MYNKTTNEKFLADKVYPLTNQNHWLQVKEYSYLSHLSEQLNEICHQYNNNHGWVLMVNTEQELVSNLVHATDLNISKILRVSGNKSPIDIVKIQQTLLRGNCAVIVLCNVYYSEEELLTLLACAEKGNTHCILLNNKPNLH